MNRLNYLIGVAKLNRRHRLLFQRLFFGAALGGLLSLFFSHSPLLETLELDMLETRYIVAEGLQSLPWWPKSPNRALSTIAVVGFDDQSQFDIGTARFNEDWAQDQLADVINRIEEGKPAVVVVDLDLRGATSPALIDSLRRNNNIVLALFGSLEGSSDLPSAEYTNRAAGLGYHDLPREPGGKVVRLPTHLAESEDSSPHTTVQPVQSLARAVLLAYRNATGVNYERRLAMLRPDQTAFINYHDVSYPFYEMRNVWQEAFDPKVFADRIVLIGATVTTKKDPNKSVVPFRSDHSDVLIHADALATVINGETIVSFPKSYAKHFLLLVGGIIGAIASALPMGKRTLSTGVSAVLLLVLAQFSFQVLHVALPVVSPLAMIASGLVLGTVIFLDTDLRQRNKELQAAREMMQLRAEEERKRIAEDLHDETLPALSSIARMVDDMSVEFGGSQSPGRMRAQLDATIQEMRRVINDLHPSVLETMGFIPALENLVRIVERETGIQGNFEAALELSEAEVSDFAKLQIYRVVQEALNNVRKHSQALAVEVIIRRKAGHLEIKVVDNGRGIDPAKIRPDSHGLLNIRHRAALVGASVEWRKPRNHPSGTEFVVITPLLLPDQDIAKGMERKV